MKKLFLILLAVLMLCSCGVQEEPQISESSVAEEFFEETNPGENCTLPEEEENISAPEEPEVAPVPEDENKIEIPSEDFSFEKPEILYPEFLTEKLSSSPAFESAMEKPSVITYQKEPVTDCLAATNFVEAFEKGEYAEFYLYSFSHADFDDSYSLYYQHFTTKDGLVYREGAYLYDWEGNFVPEEKTLHNFVEINERGYFGIGWEWGDFSYYKVISDFSLYENEAKHRELKEKYIDPIFTITVSPQEFTSASDLSSDFVWLFEDIYNYENGHDPWQEYGDYWPLEDMEKLLNRYFNGVTKEMIISDRKSIYDPETDTIYYPGGRGGAYPEIRVCGFEQNGDILTLYYELYNPEVGEFVENKYFALEILVLSKESFRYLSQDIIERKP